MHRVFVLPDAVHGDQITITDPRDVHHLRHVLRLKAGDPLECFDGQGRAYRGAILRCAGRQLTVAIDARAEEPSPPVRMTLALALIKPARFEWVLEKATELGVAEIVPMVTSRTTLRPGSRVAEHRRLRWRRILEAAATQCGRATVPVLQPPQPFEAILRRLAGRRMVLLTLAEDGPVLDASAPAFREAADLVLLIGPEGDFSPDEVALAKRYGAKTARLGRLTLRSETAALVALALVQHATEGW